VGDLSSFHPGTLLARVQDAVVERAGVDPAEIEHMILAQTIFLDRFAAKAR